MPQACGIYGFTITRAFVVDGLRFIPVHSSFLAAKHAARDLEQYNLTAAVVAENISADLRFCLEAVLSFIEHLDVIITRPEELADNNPLDQLEKTLRIGPRHNGGGPVIVDDTTFPNSRPTFVKQALQLLGNDSYCKSTGYRTLFFKVTETFRQRKPFIEISYFLLFSGLETYVRKTLINATSKNSAKLLRERLKEMGFNVCQFSENHLQRSMSTYVHLRDALFHNSAVETTSKSGGTARTYRLVDYFGQFSILMALVVIKATEFDDGHLNWDAWTDRQLFM